MFYGGAIINCITSAFSFPDIVLHVKCNKVGIIQTMMMIMMMTMTVVTTMMMGRDGLRYEPSRVQYV